MFRKIELTSKLIIDLNGAIIKAKNVGWLCFKLSRELILRIFLILSVISCKRGSILEAIGS